MQSVYPNRDGANWVVLTLWRTSRRERNLLLTPPTSHSTVMSCICTLCTVQGKYNIWYNCIHVPGRECNNDCVLRLEGLVYISIHLSYLAFSRCGLSSTPQYTSDTAEINSVSSSPQIFQNNVHTTETQTQKQGYTKRSLVISMWKFTVRSELYELNF